MVKLTEKLNVRNAGLSLGILFAIMHILGIITMRLGGLKYWMWAHFVDFNYTIQNFNVLALIVGTAVAFAVGVFIGIIFTLLYNALSE